MPHLSKNISCLLSAASLSLALLAGCSNKEQKALDQAKAQAASTNTPQQIHTSIKTAIR